MKKYYAIALLLSLAGGSVCQAQKPIELFNGRNLRNWIPYLQSASQDAKQEIHVHNGVLWLSGQYGYLRSEEQYENYKLTVEWRWPDTLSNSGIFLHSQPDLKIWPENFECQLQAGNAGDIYLSGEITCHQYDGKTKPAIITKQNPSSEKPQGEWNQAEITCTGDTITIYINGVLQNQITGISKTKGYIGLQSEGEPVEFRKVVLTPIPRPIAETPKEKTQDASEPAKKEKKKDKQKEADENVAPSESGDHSTPPDPENRPTPPPSGKRRPQ